MRKTKVYRPRRGMRLTFGRRGVSPTAGFVGGGIPIDPVTVEGGFQRPLSVKQNDGDVGDILSSSVSYGNVRPSGLYNRTLLGTGIAGLGRPYSTTAPQSIGIGEVDLGVVMTPQTASVPSWTNIGIANQSFVITAFSSSDHPSQALNYFRSGTQAVEDSSVPASATLYYSKQQRYQTVTVKKTASVFDTALGNPPPGVHFPSSFTTTLGSFINRVTGTDGLHSSSLYYPAVIPIDVPVSGRLVDIKVWVELIHVSGGQFPLGNLGVALRSPNVKWGRAHPIRNDVDFVLAATAGDQNLLGPADRFYLDSFILWESFGLFGLGIEGTGGPWANAVAGSQQEIFRMFPCWNRDRGMRVIFTDSSPVPNPRHLYNRTSPSGNFIGAPCEFLGVPSSAYGFDVPWTSETNAIFGSEPYQAAGSPPKGWLNGPGGTNLDNEWPTTGSNYGTATLRPMYSLLDPIVARKELTNEYGLLGATAYDYLGVDSWMSVDRFHSWVGKRPGLRGSEISGTWQLLLAMDYPSFEFLRTDTFFRQVRLEITYENGREPQQVRQQSALAPRRSGRHFIYAISGSEMLHDIFVGTFMGLDGFKTNLFVDVPTQADIGRTYGIGLNTGSFDPSNFALVYRLTGTLADISGSAPGWLLNNRFGMPAIPVSSASLVSYAAYSQSTQQSAQLALSPNKTLDGPKNLMDLAADLNPPQTIVQIASAFVSSSLA